MTPMMLTLLNLPRQVRNAFGNIMLVGIIPGHGNSEASKLDPYIEIMVDELLHLTTCKIVDAYLNAPVDLKIKVLNYVMDYPGLSKVFNQQGSGGLSACHWCHVRGEFCKHLNKVIYSSKNRCLSKDNPLEYPMETEKPQLRNQGLENASRQAYENARKKVNKSILASATGCKGNYALKKLPGHNRLDETQPDACHTVKDVLQNIMKLLTNKGIDISKISKAEQACGRSIIDHHPKDRVLRVPDKLYKGNTTDSSEKLLTFLLTDHEKRTADEQACNIRPPHGFGLKPSPFITKTFALKSHDWKQLGCHGILKFCLRDCLSKHCRETLFFFLDVVAELCNEHQCPDDLNDLEIKLDKALALLERDFPLTLQNITTHIMHHVIQGIRNLGPVYGTWMFVYERFNSWICKRFLTCGTQSQQLSKLTLCLNGASSCAVLVKCLLGFLICFWMQKIRTLNLR